MPRIGLTLALALLLAGCVIPNHRVHERALDDAGVLTSEQKVVVLPLDVEVSELSAGGLQEVVPEWTRQAEDNLRAALRNKASSLIEQKRLVLTPEQNPEQQARLDEYAKLIKEVWGTGQLYPTYGGPAWLDRVKHYDYSVGPGLAYLAEQTGAQRGLLLIARDVHSTGGRKALSFVGAAFGLFVPLGHRVVVAVVLDLQTGDILWTNSHVDAASSSLLNPGDVSASLDLVFENYPGIESYRKFARGK